MFTKSNKGVNIIMIFYLNTNCILDSESRRNNIGLTQLCAFFVSVCLL